MGPSDVLGIDLLNILSNKMEIFVLIIHVIILSVSNSISFSLKYYLECNFFLAIVFLITNSFPHQLKLFYFYTKCVKPKDDYKIFLILQTLQTSNHSETIAIMNFKRFISSNLLIYSSSVSKFLTTAQYFKRKCEKLQFRVGNLEVICYFGLK